MEIKEISIGDSKPTAKKVSPKLKNKTEKYLAQHDIALNQLTEPQKQTLFKSIKAKRAVKWWVAAGIFSGLLLSIVSYYNFSLLQNILAEFMPNSFSVTIEDGTEKVFELDEEDKEYLANYGLVSAILGGVFTAGIYMAASVFATMFTSIVLMRDRKKIFDAFLPAVKSNPRQTQQDTEKG